MEYSLNNRKVLGAIVWHRGRLRKITKTELDFKGRITIEYFYRVKPSSVRLARKNDPVKFRIKSLLPQRDQLKCDMIIKYISKNGIIGTDKDAHSNDGTDYSRFIWRTP